MILIPCRKKQNNSLAINPQVLLIDTFMRIKGSSPEVELRIDTRDLGINLYPLRLLTALILVYYR